MESSSPSHPPISSRNPTLCSHCICDIVTYPSFISLCLPMLCRLHVMAFTTWKIPTNPLKHTQVPTSPHRFSSLFVRANCSNSTLFTTLFRHWGLAILFHMSMCLPSLDHGLLEDKDAVHLILLPQHLAYSRA